MIGPRSLLCAAVATPLGLILFGDSLKNVPVLGYVVSKLPTLKGTAESSAYITGVKLLNEWGKFIPLGDKIGQQTVTADIGRTLAMTSSMYTGTGKLKESNNSIGDLSAQLIKISCKWGTTALYNVEYLDLCICEPFSSMFSLTEKDRKKEAHINKLPSYFGEFYNYIVSDSKDFCAYYWHKLVTDPMEILERSTLSIFSKAVPIQYASECYEDYGLRTQLNAWAKAPLQHAVNAIAGHAIEFDSKGLIDNYKTITTAIGPQNVVKKIVTGITIGTLHIGGSFFKESVTTLIFTSWASLMKNMFDDAYAFVNEKSAEIRANYTTQELIDLTIGAAFGLCVLSAAAFPPISLIDCFAATGIAKGADWYMSLSGGAELALHEEVLP